MVIVPEQGGPLGLALGVAGLTVGQVLPDLQGRLGLTPVLLQLAQFRPEAAGIFQGRSRAGHQRPGRARMGGLQPVERTMQREHPVGQRAIARIAGGQAVAGRHGAFEAGEPRPALEEEEVLHRRAVGLGFEGRQARFQVALAHGFGEVQLSLIRIHKEDGPAAGFQQRIGSDGDGVGLGGFLQGIRAGLPDAHGDQALGLAHHRRAVGEALQGLEAHPVGPEHHAQAAAHQGLIRHFHADAASAGELAEQGGAPEPVGHGLGQGPQGLVLAPPGVPPGGRVPDARALEALEGPVEPRPQLVIQVPAPQARG